MKAIVITLALLAVAPLMSAQAQTSVDRRQDLKPIQVVKPLRVALPGSTATFDGIGTNLPIASISLAAKNNLVTFTSGTASGGTTSGVVPGKVTLSEITIVRNADDASGDIFTYCTTGKRIPSAVLKSGGFTFRLTDVLVSSQQFATDENGNLIETLTLWYARIQITTPGNKNAGWDVKTNSKV
ncbi:MAG: type VI secretion system tube protein Hcp [Armatimonas sp.]